MAGGFAIGGNVANLTSYGAVTASTSLTTVTAAGSANTKGAYTQITASTTADISWLYVMLDFVPTTGSGQTCAVDIAIGAGGSEQVTINNLMCAASYYGGCQEYGFPFNIPKGTRIAARCQSSTASKTCGVAILGASGGFTNTEGSGGVDSLGFNTATTTGTPVGAGGGANTLSAYGQLVASTARNYTAIFGYMDFGTALEDNGWFYMMNLAFGAGGSEQIRVPNIAHDSNGEVQSWRFPFVPLFIPAGTRLAANDQANFGSGHAPNVTIYGVY